MRAARSVCILHFALCILHSVSWRWLAAAFAIAWSLASAASSAAQADEQRGSAGTEKGVAKQAAAALDYEKLAQALKNRNKPPRLVDQDGDQIAKFPADFDWDEQARVLKAMRTLADNVDQCGPILIDSLTDQSYCLTLRDTLSSHWDSNLSVGDVCRKLLVHSVTAAHMKYPPGGKEAYNHLAYPTLIPRTPKETQAWFRDRQRQGKELYELQIELCEWAIKEIPSIERMSKEGKKQSIAKIKEQIDELSRTKKPELSRMRNFFRWEDLRAVGWTKPSKQELEE